MPATIRMSVPTTMSSMSVNPRSPPRGARRTPPPPERWGHAPHTPPPVGARFTQQIAREYLHPLVEEGINTLVLGCTHYPLLKPLLCRELGGGVRLIDSAAETAAEIGRVLREQGIETTADAEVKHRFVASDDPLQFLQLGQRFLGNAIDGVEVHTFV